MEYKTAYILLSTGHSGEATCNLRRAQRHRALKADTVLGTMFCSLNIRRICLTLNGDSSMCHEGLLLRYRPSWYIALSEAMLASWSDTGAGPCFESRRVPLFRLRSKPSDELGGDSETSLIRKVRNEQQFGNPAEGIPKNEHRFYMALS